QAQDVAPGPIVVGGSTLSSDTTAPFVFTPAGGIVEIGPFGPNMYIKSANAISADGAVIVGQVTTDFFSSQRPFVWTAARGPVVIGTLPGGSGDAAALDVSADGRVVVGYANLAFTAESVASEAFLWTPQDGFSRLADLGGGS